MTFLSILALAVAALVAAPYLAHRLRRKRAEELPFAPARLVPPAPPKARSRARLEDKWLFLIRAASVVVLAVLGASPLVRCSRLALTRSGASVAVAIVLDDSMSMRIEDGKRKTRFSRARDGAREILASLREGDAAAIVFAGAPARVGLAATTDIGAARAVLEAATETDRATDLDAAVAIAKTLVAELPQIDRRVIVLSDLADGKPDGAPLGEGLDIPLWLAMPDLSAPAEDCGILAADRTAGRVRVRFACSSTNGAAGRAVEIRDADKVIAKAPLPETQLGEAQIPISYDDARDLTATLTGADAIGSDDRAPVVVETGPAALAVVGDRADESVATGGAPVIEQALAALHVEMAVRPIPQAPDRREDTQPFAAIIVDDPPGFTPEQRHALGAFVDRGGLLFLALGRRAAAAPLGANFEPFLTRAVGFSEAPPAGADPQTGATFFGESAGSLVDLAAKGRAKLEPDDVATLEPLVKWSDGFPLVARRARGRGELWLTTLPFSVDVSDFALRPGFLAMLDGFVAEARERAVPRRGDVGVPWTFAGADRVEAVGPAGPLTPARDVSGPGPAPPPGGGDDGVLRVVPQLVGDYLFTIDGAKERRVAAPVAREIDLRKRATASAATSPSNGGGVAVVDASWIVALVLLALVAGELALRAATRTPNEA